MSVFHRHVLSPSPLARFSAFREVARAALLKETRYRAEDICRFALLTSDAVVVLGTLMLAFYIRFDFLGRTLPPESFLAPSAGPGLPSYAGTIVFGGALLLFIQFLDGAYQTRTLLRFRRSFGLIIKSLLVWVVAYPGISLILELDERLSRVYVVISFGLLLLFLSLSRFAVHRIVLKTGISAACRQRILFVDWTDQTARIARAVLRDTCNPYELVGCAPNIKNSFTSQPPEEIPALGSYQEISTLCEKGLVDIVILADGRLNEHDVLRLARECEKSLVDFMVIPSGFQILISGLELATISGVPVLGVTKLPLHHPVNWALKRSIDVIGASIGLLISAPIIAVLALLVYLESPGPVFYRQVRVGRRGRLFRIIKIRSMKLNAEKESGARWAAKDDDRKLRLGAFMRRWNLDELPQFWNVLVGDLSLVGPRPERPELIKQFRERILYYNARHNIVPGMTGWAQVNGLRGDTDLGERIRCDIYYIENWSPILDIQIMLLTFCRWEGAY
ncbi:MAG: exopolysaccharide biosynthesis polyprenyl glycosylphosphotransferase [Terrimicrobiaceae bacterium]